MIVSLKHTALISKTSAYLGKCNLYFDCFLLRCRSQKQDNISLYVSSPRGHQKRCEEWWSYFFAFLSQQAFAPFRSPGAILCSSGTTFFCRWAWPLTCERAKTRLNVTFFPHTSDGDQYGKRFVIPHGVTKEADRDIKEGRNGPLRTKLAKFSGHMALKFTYFCFMPTVRFDLRAPD